MVAVSHPILEAKGLRIETPGGRVLVDGLDLALDGDPVAIVGRNGVGKSTLLRVLAGEDTPARGRVVCRSDQLLVPQELAEDGRSQGERRRHALSQARERSPGVLLLDEPTDGLDVHAIDELVDWTERFAGTLVVASHHRALLERFRCFFLMEETGCRAFVGSLAALERDLERRHEEGQVRYARQLRQLEARERHHERVKRRKRRKRNLGRIHEEGRAPSRAQLHGKKGYAQVSQGKAASLRATRLDAERQWAKAARRALAVRLPLELAFAELPPKSDDDSVRLEKVELSVEGQLLLSGFDLRLGRQRLGVVGPNGAGKSTLLAVLRGRRRPTRGAARITSSRIAGVDQAANDWRSEESLLEHLMTAEPDLEPEGAMRIVAAHRFPLGLAARPLRSLSAGERTRAALIAVVRQGPEIVVLDEPTASLDFIGAAALTASLRRWQGGLVVASHDRAFLDAIRIERRLELDGRGGHRWME